VEKERGRGMNARIDKVLPFALILVGVSLYCVKYYAGVPILYFPLLVIIALLLASAARHAGAARLMQPDFPSYRTTVSVLVMVVAVYFLVMTAMAIAKYDAFSLRMYDFGLMDQGIWNTAHGRLLEVTQSDSTCDNVSRLSTHVEVMYLAFAALYRIVSDPRVLFVAQTLFVCWAIVLLFVIARRVLGAQSKALAVACAAALYPALQFMVIFDFHGDVLAIPFFLLSYLGYLRQKKWMFWCGLAGALLCKEYAGLAAAGYGLALIAAHRDWKRGAMVCIVGAAYFLAAFYVVAPFFNQGSESAITLLDYRGVGGESGLGGMLGFAGSHPLAFLAKMKTMQNAESLFYLFFPLAFLPLLSPAFLLGALPVFVKDMLFGMDIGNHHLACGIPFVFISFIYGIKRCEKIMANPRFSRTMAAFGLPLLLVCVMSVMATFFYGPSPLGHQFWRGRGVYTVSPHARACEAVIKTIPASARVSVSDDLSPHLTHRQYCYVFPAPLSIAPSLLRSVDYICVDTLFRRSLFWTHTNFAGQTLPMIRSLGFDSIMEKDGVFLFKNRNAK
jgi:uncharacterized membrane protein